VVDAHENGTCLAKEREQSEDEMMNDVGRVGCRLGTEQESKLRSEQRSATNPPKQREEIKVK